jgi:hypothetical protein
MSDLDDHPFSPKSVAYESGEWEEYPMEIDIGMQIKAVAREVAMRERLYPKWVEQGKMKLDMAEREIANMKAVLDTLIKVRTYISEQEEGTLDYFNRYVAGDR